MSDRISSDILSVLDMCAQDLGKSVCESVYAIILGRDKGVMTALRLADGDMDRALASFDKLVAALFDNGAAEFIIAHSHPRRTDMALSAEDICATERISALAGRLGFRLVEHVIMTECGYIYALRTMGQRGYHPDKYRIKE